MVNLGDIVNGVLYFTGYVVYLAGWILDGLNLIISFTGSMVGLVSSILNLAYGFIASLFSIHPYASVVISIIILGTLAKTAVILYNIIAEMQLLGFKLPKLPL